MPAPSPERLLDLLQAFINAPSWAESRRVVEQHPELLTPEADALLKRVLAQYQDDARAARILGEHRDLLRRCREEGVEAAFADHRDADPEEAMRALLERAESDPQARAALEEMQRRALEHPLMRAVQALVETRSPAEVLEAVREHPALLSDEADAMLRQSIENARQMGEEGMAHHVEERCQTLRQIREQGVGPEQLAAVAAMAEAIPPELRAIMDELGPVSSEAELEEKLRQRPDLRERLVHHGVNPSAVLRHQI